MGSSHVRFEQGRDFQALHPRCWQCRPNWRGGRRAHRVKNDGDVFRPREVRRPFSNNALGVGFYFESVCPPCFSTWRPAGRPAGGKTGRALAERRGVPRVSSFPTAGHQDGAAESGSKQLVPDRAGLRAGRTTSPPKSGAETIGYGPGIPARPPSLASSAAGRERRQSRGPLFRTLRNKSVIGSRRAA